MTELSFPWSPVMQALAAAVPVCFALGAAIANDATPARRSTWFAMIAAVLAALFVAGLVAMPAGDAHGLVRVDGVTATMLLLVCGLGLAVARYSQTYLAGDPGQGRYARWLLATLAAVTMLVVANNLLAITAAWTLTSIALHKLLTFYGDRPAALVAAHKKFLVSRLADLCLWSALALIYRSVGSLQLDAIASWVGARGDLPASLRLAAALCVVSAALKSAQLPFHGWLTQVMEAPTPVSALLHAGVVNLGGLLMIRLAPLMARAPAAQLLLVAIGMVTAVLAALISTTRVSVKVALAWSTCAQMGFMLVECGLGAWHLALLHLVAHSLYKAHAFLGAGSAVETWRIGTLAPRSPSPALWRLGVSALAVLGIVALVVAGGPTVGAPFAAPSLASAVLALLVALSLVPMLTNRLAALPGLGLRALAVATLYVGCHVAAGRLWPALAHPATSAVVWAVVALGFGALFVAQSAVALRPQGRFARALHTWLFAGLYLDERFTRLTFRVWPPRMAKPAASPLTHVRAAMEISS